MATSWGTALIFSGCYVKICDPSLLNGTLKQQGVRRSAAAERKVNLQNAQSIFCRFLPPFQEKLSSVWPRTQYGWACEVFQFVILGAKWSNMAVLAKWLRRTFSFCWFLHHQWHERLLSTSLLDRALTATCAFVWKRVKKQADDGWWWGDIFISDQEKSVASTESWRSLKMLSLLRDLFAGN